MLASIIIGPMYGLEISSMADEYVSLANTAVEGIAAARVPGLYWVEFLPVLKHVPAWVPGAAARIVSGQLCSK